MRLQSRGREETLWVSLLLLAVFAQGELALEAHLVRVDLIREEEVRLVVCQSKDIATGKGRRGLHSRPCRFLVLFDYLLMLLADDWLARFGGSQLLADGERQSEAWLRRRHGLVVAQEVAGQLVPAQLVVVVHVERDQG